MYKFETTPLTLSGIFKESWAFFRASIASVVLWSFLISVVHILPNLFGFFGFYHQNCSGHLVFSWWGLLFYVVLLTAVSYFLAVLLYIMYSIATEQKVNYRIVFNQAAGQFVNVYFAILIYFIIGVVGLFLLILPAVFLCVLFSMFLFYILYERDSIYYAYEKSAKLIWGHWWQTFFVIAIPYSIGFLVRILGKVFNLHTDWTLLADLIVQTLVLPYFYAALLIQFNNLKVIKSLPDTDSQRPTLHSELNNSR